MFHDFIEHNYWTIRVMVEKAQSNRDAMKLPQESHSQ